MIPIYPIYMEEKKKKILKKFKGEKKNRRIFDNIFI